jgi:hypothetical protein
MQKFPALSIVIGVSLVLAAFPAGAQSTDLLEQLKIMRQQLEEQRRRVDELERQLRASGAVAPSQLDKLRGTGNPQQRAHGHGRAAIAGQRTGRRPARDSPASSLNKLRGAGPAVAADSGQTAAIGGAPRPSPQPINGGNAVGRPPEPAARPRWRRSSKPRAC